MVMNAISHTFSLNTSMTIILLCTNKIKQEETILTAHECEWMIFGGHKWDHVILTVTQTREYSIAICTFW